MTTTVPNPTLTAAGWTMPAESDILTAVLNDLNSAFGGEFEVDYVTYPSVLSTPQGQLASTLAAIIADKNRQFLQLVNQVDPLYSFGRMQDAIGKIYFMSREPAIPTTVVATCTGAVGTVIPANAQAKDLSGNLYVCPAGGIVGGGGTVSLTFENVVAGPIPCGINTLTKIYVQTPGWDTITNPAIGALGRSVETPLQFELRRANSVALNGSGSVQSIYAAVFSSGASLLPTPIMPTDVFVTENTLATTATISGVFMVANSIYVSVVGGDDQSIADAIWSKKSSGSNYNGGTTVTVTDLINPGSPTYQVKFQKAASLPIFISVNLVPDVNLPGNIATLVKDAIVASWATIHIGGAVYASKFYGAIQAVDPAVQIISVFVGIISPGTLLSVGCTIAEYPTIDPVNITVIS